MFNTQEKYAFKRDKRESERLNAQHKLITQVTDNTLIHPSIPKKNVLAIADIATGTGIWLQDVSDMLENAGIQSYCHGFDISAAQFPAKPGNVQFSVQDILEPFPKEHWNRYDIVHVRLVIAAIAECDYRIAVENLSAILKPGGFLQWEEVDEESYISKDNPAIWEIHRCFGFGYKAEGKCFQASTKVVQECTAAGFLDVVRLSYSSDANPALRLDTDKLHSAIMQTLYPSLLLRSGQVPDEETASKRAMELLEQHDRLCADGLSPPLIVMRVVAQKPMDAPL